MDSKPAIPPKPIIDQPTRRKWVLPAIVVGILLLTIPAVVYMVQRQTQLTSGAWNTTHTASAQCASGKININVSFTNTESNSASKCMNVVAKDLQSGQTVNLGQIQPGQTKTGTISLNSANVSNGQVKFDLTWCDGRSGQDSKISSYTGLTCTDSSTLTCGEVKIYNSQGQQIAVDSMTVGETITLVVNGTTNHAQGITQARFSTDGGSTWTITTQKNAAGEFTLAYVVENKTSITIDGQVYNPILGWK